MILFWRLFKSSFLTASFTFPEVGDLFEAVEYAELEQEEASKLIEEYRTEARKKGPPPEKRFRGGCLMIETVEALHQRSPKIELVKLTVATSDGVYGTVRLLLLSS